MISDIKDLIPEKKIIGLTDRKSGEVFEVDLFMPGEIGLLFIEHDDVIRKLFNGKIDKSALSLSWKIFEMMFQPQHSFMTEKWCKKNIDLPTMIALLIQMGKPIYDYLKVLGMTGMPEAKNLS